jgi:hypothetical protein
VTALVVFYVLLALVAVWVYRDCDGRDWSRSRWASATPGGWATAVFLLWPIFLPMYLWQRRSVQSWDEKTCPECAETVKQEALVCRFCRRRFA